MSANGTGTGSVSSQAAVSPGQSISFMIHSSLNSLIISHTFLTLLVPLIISLFYFSTPQGRRRPIFLLNVAVIFPAFAVGALIDVYSIQTILDPSNLPPLTLGIAIGFLGVCQSILVDSILLVRLITVYPPWYTGMTRFSLLIAIPVLLKLTRIVNIIQFAAVNVHATSGPDVVTTSKAALHDKPYLTIEWTAQMVDNAYVSFAFLWRIRDWGNNRIISNSNSATLAQCMRTLSRIALTNFMVPTMFSIAQFVCAYRGVSAEILEQLVLVNIMLATFGVAFATVWAGNTNRQEAQQTDLKRVGSHLMHMVESISWFMPRSLSSIASPSPRHATEICERDVMSNE